MPTFVSLPNATRISLHLAPTPVGPYEIKQLRSKFGVQFVRKEEENAKASLVSGKDAGTDVQVIGPNQRAVLTLGAITPYKYQAILAVNPAFNVVANVQAPLIIEPKETCPVRLVITAHKEIDLNDFDWFCRVYLFE